MPDFDYYQPQTTAELITLLDHTGGKILAGGTDVLPRLRRGQLTAACLIDVSRLSELHFIRLSEERLQIGALTTHAELLASPLIQAVAPALAQAAATIGSPQTRQRGTLGGNLANASPAADTAPPLLVLETQITLAGLHTQRNVDLQDFFVGPGATCLTVGEYIDSVYFPRPTGKWGASFYKLGRRNGMAIAVVSAAAFLELDSQGRLQTARLALGSVAPCPVRCPHAEAVLVGQIPEQTLFQKVGQSVQADIQPIDDLRASAPYRQHAAGIVSERVLNMAWQQAARRQV